MKCEACGDKIKKDESKCKSCGYEMYRSEFADIASEINEELKSVSEDDLISIAKERKSEPKHPFDEFEKMYTKKYNVKKPRQRNNIFGMLFLFGYKSDMKKAYKDYLDGIGYE